MFITNYFIEMLIDAYYVGLFVKQRAQLFGR